MIKFAALFMVGCWTFVFANTFEFHYQHVNSDFQPYVDEFYSLLHKMCPSKEQYEVNYYDIDFGKPAKDDVWIGICKPRFNGYEINIDPDFWKFADEQDQRQLIYHELSHCVMYREHINDPTNYMNPVIERIDPELVLTQLRENINKYCNE